MNTHWILQYRTDPSMHGLAPTSGNPSTVSFTRFSKGVVHTRLFVKMTNRMGVLANAHEHVLSVLLVRDNVVNAYPPVTPGTKVPVVSRYATIEAFAAAAPDVARDLVDYIVAAVPDDDADYCLSVACVAARTLFGTNNTHASRFAIQRQVLDALFESV